MAGPQCCYWQCKELGAKPKAYFAVVQNNATGKAITSNFLELAQAPEIIFPYCCGGLDLNTCQVGALLQDDVNFTIITMAKVKETDAVLQSTGLTTEFLQNKSLQQLTKQITICVKAGGVEF